MSLRRSYMISSCLYFPFTALLLFSLIPFLASDIKAAVIPWDSNGAGNGFYWANGGSDKGLFGNPTLTNGNTLHFSPQNFSAESTNGKTSIKYDSLQVDIIAKPGEFIKSIRIIANGHYDIDTAGKISDSGAIFATNLSQYEVCNATFLLNPVMPVTSATLLSGDWNGQAAVNLPGWTYLRIVLNNNLIATSLKESQSYIDKTSFDIQIDTINNSIPEPTTICMLGIGALSLLRRKK
jgi:hypothetical protein